MWQLAVERLAPAWIILRFGSSGSATKPLPEGLRPIQRDRVSVRVYSPEKTLADCFKYRNKIGIDTVIEALKLYQQRKSLRVNELLRFAHVSRVLKVMRPYLEALL